MISRGQSVKVKILRVNLHCIYTVFICMYHVHVLFFVVTFVNLQYWPPEPCGPLRCGSVGQGCPRRSLDQTAMQNMQNDFLSMQKKSRHKKSRSTLFFPCIIAFDKRNENIANELSRILAQTLAQCTSRLPLSTRAWISQSFCFFLLMISFTRLWKFCCSI